ncbi:MULTISPECIES: phage tail assembly protein [Arsenophonus]|uniref:Phage tail assembly protein n=1 Tax=Arsenophonus nasoniae TaxID=638 RepID=A0AA95GQ27_9GAMM|nr:phage tail assembly protein [Arsenophonus nasoniae]WGM01006.1 phage tail assembly protein [Arsenophonus nasoniae]
MNDTYPLRFPYPLANGEMLTQVTVRRLTVRDMKQVRKQSQDPSDLDELLVASMTGLLPEDLDKMDLADYQALHGRFRDLAGLDTVSGTTA